MSGLDKMKSEYFYQPEDAEEQFDPKQGNRLGYTTTCFYIGTKEVVIGVMRDRDDRHKRRIVVWERKHAYCTLTGKPNPLVLKEEHVGDPHESLEKYVSILNSYVEAPF